MAENKTKATAASVAAFIASVVEDQQRKDARALDRLFREVTGVKPAMWGPSIVGYGSYHYVYASGRQGDFLRVGFSPRKGNLAVYIMPGLAKYGAALGQLGKVKAGKACLYIKRLEDVDVAALKALLKKAWADMNKQYPL